MIRISVTRPIRAWMDGVEIKVEDGKIVPVTPPIPLSKKEQNMISRAKQDGGWVFFSNIPLARLLAKRGYLIEGELGYFKAPPSE